jgi:hypothetical protein
VYRSYQQRKEKGKIVPFSKEWLVIDRILDVKWDNEPEQKAQSVLAVFKDRDYAEGKKTSLGNLCCIDMFFFFFFLAIWDDPPSEDETDLYPDYKIALNRYIQSTKVLPPANMKNLVAQVRSKARAENYEKHELKVQPKFITGGQMMKHQMEALK